MVVIQSLCTCKSQEYYQWVFWVFIKIFFLVLGSEIINQGIELQTELGANAQDILLRGEAIPEEVCAKVLLDKISSPEVAHHGEW